MFVRQLSFLLNIQCEQTVTWPKSARPANDKNISVEDDAHDEIALPQVIKAENEKENTHYI